MNRNIIISRRGACSCLKTLFAREKLTSSSLFQPAVRNISFSDRRNMKFVQFVENQSGGQSKSNERNIRVGFLDKDNVVDINKLDSTLPTTLIEILKNGLLDKVKGLKPTSSATIPLSSVSLKAPILNMDKVLCIGLNYKDHCEEQKLTPPAVPMIFSKFASDVIGPTDVLKLRTDITKKVDWEVELVVVIGKKAVFVKEAQAWDYIMGCTIAQDISARDWQKERNAGQFLLGKAMDGFCPIGPCIVTLDELGNPEDLEIKYRREDSTLIKCSVNGTLKQKSRTDQLIHRIPAVIERLTSVMTLLPGDIILTGTPGGVGLYRNPPEFLQPGDVITSEIQNIGVLETRVEKF